MSDRKFQGRANIELTNRTLASLLGGLVASKTGDASNDPAPSGAATVQEPATTTSRRPRPTRRRKPAQLPKWNVVLLDDDEHTHEYVVDMLGRLFAHSIRLSLKMAREVDTGGRVVVLTTHRELAELKCEQILKFGADPRIGSCTGSMKAIIEPAA